MPDYTSTNLRRPLWVPSLLLYVQYYRPYSLTKSSAFSGGLVVVYVLYVLSFLFCILAHLLTSRLVLPLLPSMVWFQILYLARDSCWSCLRRPPRTNCKPDQSLPEALPGPGFPGVHGGPYGNLLFNYILLWTQVRLRPLFSTFYFILFYVDMARRACYGISPFAVWSVV